MIAVDKWHLVARANLMVTQVRQRVTRQLHGRRGVTSDKVWANIVGRGEVYPRVSRTRHGQARPFLVRILSS